MPGLRRSSSRPAPRQEEAAPEGETLETRASPTQRPELALPCPTSPAVRNFDGDEGLGLDSTLLDIPLPKSTPPPVPGPETWIAELEAKSRFLEEEAKERFLLEYLEALADFLREEADVKAVIRWLEERLEDLEAAVNSPQTPSGHNDQLRSAIAVVKKMIVRSVRRTSPRSSGALNDPPGIHQRFPGGPGTR